MAKFNFLDTPEVNRETNIGRVRTRATGRDRYAGLRGRDYLDARDQERRLTREDDAPVTPAWLMS